MIEYELITGGVEKKEHTASVRISSFPYSLPPPRGGEKDLADVVWGDDAIAGRQHQLLVLPLHSDGVEDVRCVESYTMKSQNNVRSKAANEGHTEKKLFTNTSTPKTSRAHTHACPSTQNSSSVCACEYGKASRAKIRLLCKDSGNLKILKNLSTGFHVSQNSSQQPPDNLLLFLYIKNFYNHTIKNEKMRK